MAGDNIKLNIKEVRCRGLDLIYLALNKVQR
jgi:hypothetical protein